MSRLQKVNVSRNEEAKVWGLVCCHLGCSCQVISWAATPSEVLAKPDLMTSTVSRHCFESRRVRYWVARMSLWRLAAYNPLTSKIWRIQANSILLCGEKKNVPQLGVWASGTTKYKHIQMPPSVILVMICLYGLVRKYSTSKSVG